MLRWLWRLGFIGVLVIAALWVWSKLNEDLEEEEFDEEIPIEFDVPVEESEVSTPLAAVSAAPAVSSARVEVPAAVEETPAAVTADDSRKTDLEDIIGIGPVFAGRLYDAGILNIAQLAETGAEKVREAGFTEAQAEEWIRQAREMTETAKDSK